MASVVDGVARVLRDCLENMPEGQECVRTHTCEHTFYSLVLHVQYVYKHTHTDTQQAQ